ncbi:MarC family protein [Chitinimonas sp.]|uniref:MarC family protein n=1 Tax=Chitinimonas sp. TaxID=1934313 RepID=UPI0035B256AB
MKADLIEFTKSILLVLTALLPIINPPGVAPIFLTYTHGASEEERRILAKRIAINSLFMLFAAMFIGTHVLNFFGISLDVVRVGGGMVVVAAGWRLLDADEHSSHTDTKIDNRVMRKRAFYPLTFPFTIGPGSISVAITLAVSLRDKRGLDALNLAGGCVGIVLICIIVYLAYRFADKLLSRLGDTGTTVFLRLSAFILLCIGVQIFWIGASELLRGLMYEP